MYCFLGRTTAVMHENYCFKCGSYTRIDDVTKLCGACYDCWPVPERHADELGD